MTPASIVQKLWNYCKVLRDDGMNYGDDPACGTGCFLLAAHEYLVKHFPYMTKDGLRDLKDETFQGTELVQSTARLCAMNLSPLSSWPTRPFLS